MWPIILINCMTFLVRNNCLYYITYNSETMEACYVDKMTGIKEYCTADWKTDLNTSSTTTTPISTKNTPSTDSTDREEISNSSKVASIVLGIICFILGIPIIIIIILLKLKKVRIELLNNSIQLLRNDFEMQTI